jgi:hypothetical protein
MLRIDSWQRNEWAAITRPAGYARKACKGNIAIENTTSTDVPWNHAEGVKRASPISQRVLDGSGWVNLQFNQPSYSIKSIGK